MLEDSPVLPLPYKWRQPKVRLRKPPMLVLLHGLGISETDFLNMVSGFDDRFLIVSLSSPFPQSSGTTAWFNMERVGGTAFINSIEAEYSRKEVIKFVSEAIQVLRQTLDRYM